MKGRDFGLGLLGLAIVAATVTALMVSGRDTSTPARAEDTTHELSTPVSPEGCGEVTAREPGETTVPSPASQWTFPRNAYVQVTARAHEGCTFSKWVLDFGGYPVEQTTNPSQFQLTEDMTATAHFTGTPASPTATAVPPPVTASCKWSTLGEDPVLNPGLKSDCETLLKEKSTLAGTATLNWSVDTPMADWDGVGLDGTPRRVTSLVLKAKELTGSIPTSFGSLAKLDTLVLGQNQLTGAIPVELGNLASLTQLHLEQNQLTGTIPTELGNLTLLTHLVLDDNELSGDVPEELEHLTEVTHVYLAGNTLTGCVPGIWADVASSDLAKVPLPYCGAMLDYKSYDSTGTAMTDGSYSMSTTEDGVTGVATTHTDLVFSVTSIVVNVKDSDGAARTNFYNSIKVGDVVEWVPTGDEKCWQRFRVSAILPDPAGPVARKHFSLEPLMKFDQWCSGPITGEDGVLATELRWNPPAARPTEYGLPAMLLDQPVEGPLTVLLAPFAPYVVDIPEGLTLFRFTSWAWSNTGEQPAGVEDLKSGSRLWIDVVTGEELGREVVTVEGDTRNIEALFDQIVASARRVGGE